MPPPSERDARALNRQVVDYHHPYGGRQSRGQLSPSGSTPNVAGRDITVIPKRRGYQGGQIPSSQGETLRAAWDAR